MKVKFSRFLFLVLISALGFSAAAQARIDYPVGSSGGSGTPGGSSGQIQYNNGGSFGGLTIGAGLVNSSGILRSSDNVFNVTDAAYGAVCDGQVAFNGAVTALSNQLSISGVTFTAADDGKLVLVETIPSLFSGSSYPTVVFEGTLTHNVDGTATLSGNQSSSQTTGFKVRWMTDDTTAVQSAFTAAASAAAIAGTVNDITGSYIKFPSNKMCGLSGPITFYTKQSWGADSKGAVQLVSFDKTHNASMFQNLTGSGSVRTFNDNVIENMEADLIGHTCNSSYSYHCKFLEAQYMVRPIFRGLYIKNTPATSLGPDFVEAGIFVNNTIENSGRKHSGTSGGGACMAWEVAAGSFGANQGPENTIVSNNTFINCKTYAVNTEAPNTTITDARLIFTNNHVHSVLTTGNGVALVGSINDIVTGNTFQNTSAMTSGAAVNIFGAVITGIVPGTRTLVANNNIKGWWNGVALADSGTKTPDDVSVSNNKIFGSISTGINVSVSGSNTIKRLNITGNTIDGSGSAGIAFVNTGTAGTIEGLTLNGNVLTNNATTTATDANKSGILINDNVTSGTMSLNTAFDDATSTQKYGLTVGSGATVTVQESANNFTGNTTSARNIVGTFSGSLFQLPATNGTNGYVLQTDGTGITSWVSASGSAITWPTSGSIVLSNGTNSPAGISETDGNCVVGAGGVWTSGSCAGASAVNLGASTSAANPQISGDATTGLYTAGAGKVDVVVGGTKIMEWASTGGALTGTSTITSTSATALAVGANGVTNSVLSVDASTASVVTGVAIKGAATGGTSTITCTDSGSNCGLTVQGKGSGNARLTSSGGQSIMSGGAGGLWSVGTVGFSGAQSSASSGVITKYAFAAGASDTGLTASTEAPWSTWGVAASSRSHAAGALALQRDHQFYGAPDAFASASTLTDGATIGFALKNCGTNGTCTNESGIYHASTALTGTITNSYAINVAADSGATNNYAIKTTGKSLMDTIISGGTTFTVSGCSATSPVGGSSAGQFTSGTTGVCTATVTINGATGATAPNGWSCWSADETTGNLFRQTSSTTTTATFSGTTVTSDIITFGCMGY